MNQVAQKALDLTYPTLKKITAHVSAELGKTLPAVAGDSQKLVQVVINLLMNAGQALESEDQSITVTTSANQHQNIVTIEVADTGPGVSPDMLDK